MGSGESGSGVLGFGGLVLGAGFSPVSVTREEGVHGLSNYARSTQAF